MKPFNDEEKGVQREENVAVKTNNLVQISHLTLYFFTFY